MKETPGIIRFKNKSMFVIFRLFSDDFLKAKKNSRKTNKYDFPQFEKRSTPSKIFLKTVSNA